ncbi:hypothetical protein K469DRAFT_713387, partial [Zopfia rhizophila CBS 207.26]
MEDDGVWAAHSKVVDYVTLEFYFFGAAFRFTLFVIEPKDSPLIGPYPEFGGGTLHCIDGG